MVRMIRFVKFVLALLVTSVSLASPKAYAAGSVHFINYYEMLLRSFGLTDPRIIEDWKVVPGAVLTLILLIVLGWKFKTSLEASGDDVRPDGKLSVRTVVEAVLDFVSRLAQDVIGHGFEAFLPLLTGMFLFIYVSNLTGLVPGFTPATESLSTNLSMGLMVFLVYNVSGVRANGVGYLKHFLGPVWWLAPLMLAIEVIGHCVRPFSLSLRLYGNIYGDHLVLGVFTGLVPLVMPAVLLVFGLLVASVQSFVFTLLTSIYISRATSHDH